MRRVLRITFGIILLLAGLAAAGFLIYTMFQDKSLEEVALLAVATLLCLAVVVVGFDLARGKSIRDLIETLFSISPGS